MQFSIISILLVFTSTVCASPLPDIFAPSNNIQSISKRADQIPTTIEGLKQRLGSVAVDPKELHEIWKHGSDSEDLIAGSRRDGVYRLKHLYKGKKALLQELPVETPVDYVIHLVLYLNAAKMLRAFAEPLNPNADHPHVLVIADNNYVSAKNAPDFTREQFNKLLLLASRHLLNIYPDMAPYMVHDNKYLYKQTGNSGSPWEVIYV